MAGLVHVEIVQDGIEQRVTLGEFADRLVAELRGIRFKSKLFSTKGDVDPVEQEREQRAAIDRVIQRIRDERHGN